MEITAVIIPDAEAFIRENFADISIDGMCSVYPVQKLNLDGTTKVIDEYEGTGKYLTKDDFIRALKMLTEQIGKTLFLGGIKNPADLADICNWDVEIGDAFFQLAYHGEVIYG